MSDPGDKPPEPAKDPGAVEGGEHEVPTDVQPPGAGAVPEERSAVFEEAAPKGRGDGGMGGEG